MITKMRLKRILQERTLHDLRAKTGVAISKLSLIERGIEPARGDEKLRIAQALGSKPEELFSAPKGNEVHE